MKKLVIVLWITISGCLLASQIQNANTVLTGVKVFTRGAELTHSAKVKINKGISEIAFTDIAANIDQNSLNVSAKGDLIILSVVQRNDYLKPVDANPEVKVLKDSLELLTNKLISKQNEIDVWNAELDLLFANKEIGSKEKGVSIPELQKMAEFFRKRVGEIKTEITSINKDAKKIQKDVERIKNQLEELNSKLSGPTNQIIVTVSANAQTNAEFTLSYLIYDANWRPVYDVRVENINSPASLGYKANITQNSGLDWNDVNIILSTRNPVQNNDKPELNPWFIDYMRPVLYKSNAAGSLRKAAAAPTVQIAQDIKIESESESMADYVEVSETQLAAEFVPSIKYSIPSDNKQHSVALKDYTIPAKYEYYAAPKADNNAFLVTYLTNWNEFNLLPGSANIYFENSFVGQSFINPQTSKDTLALSLGRDQGIVIFKNKIKDFSEDKFLSSDIERTFAYDIVIKNNKSIPVKLLVEEQIPIPQNEDIEVKVVDISDGKYNAEDGKVKWNVEIGASKSVSKKFVFSVRYPKDKTIPNL
jgi:uncharacterized protein (TIGR02231 family)